MTIVKSVHNFGSFTYWANAALKHTFYWLAFGMFMSWLSPLLYLLLCELKSHLSIYLTLSYVTLCRFWNQVFLVLFGQIRINFLYIIHAWSAYLLQFCFMIIYNIRIALRYIDTIVKEFTLGAFDNIWRKIISWVDDSLRKRCASYLFRFRSFSSYV